MTPFDLATLFLTLSAAISWANARFLRWPNSVAVVAVGACGAIGLVALGQTAPGLANALAAPIREFNFSKAVLDVLLAFLMFAGGMQVDVSALRRAIVTTTVLATLGVALSAVLIGLCLHITSGFFGEPLSLGWALVFGALISPTDPVAVLSTLRTVGLAPPLKALMQVESLFNDGVGIVLVGATLTFALHPGSWDPGSMLADMAREGLGGGALGLALGAIALKGMHAIDDYGVEAGITLAVATGSYALAHALGVSGPIATAAAGLMIGGPRAERAMSEQTRRYVRGFWNLMDEILNSLLFLLMGAQLLVLPLQSKFLALAGAAIGLSLIARLVSVTGPALLLARFRKEFDLRIVPVLAWGGVRGGLSVALALALPAVRERPMILAMTYAVALFSILLQGPTLPRLVRALRLQHVQPDS